MTLERQLGCLARRVIEDAGQNADDAGSAIEERFATFHEHASALIGGRGVDAVVRRAAFLSRAEAPLVSELRVPGEDHRGVAGVHDALEQHGRDATMEATACLLERIVELLCQLIGAEVTSRLLRRTWPNISGEENSERARTPNASRRSATAHE